MYDWFTLCFFMYWKWFKYRVKVYRDCTANESPFLGSIHIRPCWVRLESEASRVWVVPRTGHCLKMLPNILYEVLRSTPYHGRTTCSRTWNLDFDCNINTLSGSTEPSATYLQRVSTCLFLSVKWRTKINRYREKLRSATWYQPS